MRKIRRFVAVVTIAVVPMVMVPSLAQARTPTRTPAARCRANLAAPHSVLVIGDSITVLEFADITAKFTAAGHPVCVDGLGGRTTAEAIAVLRTYKAAGMISATTSVVMAVGSNDTYLAKNGNISAQVNTVQRVLGSAHRFTQPIVWVDVLNWTANRGRAAQERYGNGTWVVNLQLWHKDVQYQNIKVARWNELIRSNPRKFTYDLLHPNAYGIGARTALILKALS